MTTRRPRQGERPGKPRLSKRESRYRGVRWESFHGRWAAVVYRPGPPKQTIRIAHFDREEEAAIAHDRVVLYLDGQRATRNFPDRSLSAASIEAIRRERRCQVKTRKTSRFNGVHVRRGRLGNRRWSAEIRVAGRSTTLGDWATEREAALAHDGALLHYNGNRALLNFPRLAARLRRLDAPGLRAEAARLRKKTTSSRFRGVIWVKRLGCWRARITVDGELRHLGLFADEEEAAKTYDHAARAAFGGKAKLNFTRSSGSGALAGGAALRRMRAGEGARQPVTKRSAAKKRPGKARGPLSARELAEMAAEATVDAYDESEQATGWFTMFENHLELPSETEVLGVCVKVDAIELREGGQIVAVCRRGKAKVAVGLSDLPLPSPRPEGAEWIEAYRSWLRGRW